MKKTSIRDLKAKGWELSDDDKTRVEFRKAAGEKLQAIQGVSDQINKLVEATTAAANNNGRTAELIETMLNSQSELIKRLTALAKIKPESAPKKWIFEVSRNDDGFISKITANSR